jgi:hypothetical protein
MTPSIKMLSIVAVSMLTLNEDIQHNISEQNNTQSNDNQHNYTQHRGTQWNENTHIEAERTITLNIMTTSLVKLSTTTLRMDTQHNNMQHNSTQYNNTQHIRLNFDTKSNKITYKYSNCHLYTVALSVVRPSVIVVIVLAPE